MSGRWTVGTVNKAATAAKWRHGALPALPVLGAVAAACLLGVSVGVRSVLANPDVQVSKTRRGGVADATTPRVSAAEARSGDAYFQHGFRSFLQRNFMTAPATADGGVSKALVLDNSHPFVMSNLYGGDARK